MFFCGILLIQLPCILNLQQREIKREKLVPAKSCAEKTPVDISWIFCIFPQLLVSSSSYLMADIRVVGAGWYVVTCQECRWRDHAAISDSLLIIICQTSDEKIAVKIHFCKCLLDQKILWSIIEDLGVFIQYLKIYVCRKMVRRKSFWKNN